MVNCDSGNLTMLTDFYDIAMANGYLKNGIGDKTAVFDVIFRQIPDHGGFAIFAGLAQLIERLSMLRFSPEDISYLRGKQMFSEDFLAYLEHFRFSCDIWSVEEGTPIFPNEPVIVVKGPLMQAAWLETLILNTINYQSLIATKANRIVRAAQGRRVIEYGARQAHGSDAAVFGARAAYIGGCSHTSCALADCKEGVPAEGFMAHSWVQVFDSEYEAFRKYAETYPDRCILLVDTYNVLKSGVPNAIRVFDEVVVPAGFRPLAIRIDSGDIGYLSKRARKMLDEAGYADVQIIASNSLDEYIIRDLMLQGAQVDAFTVGENLITSKSSPVFGAAYILAAVENDGVLVPKIKTSESIEKVATPHFKKLYRLVSNETEMCVADLVSLYEEEIQVDKGITIFDPNATWKKKYLTDVTARSLLVPIFEKGKLVYTSPSLEEIRNYCRNEVEHLWDEVKRFEFPHRYYVDLSYGLWDIRNMLLADSGINL